MRLKGSIKMSLAAGVLALAIFTSAPQPARAADAEVGVDFATAYIFRGATVNNDWVMQPYGEVSGIPQLEGLALGVWGNFDLASGSGGEPPSGEFSEVDLYASYSFGLEPVDVALGYTEYVYPQSDLSADREVNLVLSADVMLSPSVGVYYGFDGLIKEQWYFAASLTHEVSLGSEATLSLGGILGALIQGKDSAADDGVSYAALSAGLAYKIFSASVTWFIETDDKVLEIDREVLGVFGVSLTF